MAGFAEPKNLPQIRSRTLGWKLFKLLLKVAAIVAVVPYGTLETEKYTYRVFCIYSVKSKWLQQRNDVDKTKMCERWQMSYGKFVNIFQLFVYNFSKKTTATQIHFGFTNIGSEMRSFRGIAI